MRLQKINLLTGITLSVLLSAVALSPVAAQQTTDGQGSSMHQMNQMNQMTTSQMMRGTIKSIVGDLVTIQMANGETRDISLTQEEMSASNFRPGMQVVVTRMNNGRFNVALASDMTNTASMTGQQGMISTVRSIDNNTVTVVMPNGETRDIMLTQEEMSASNFRPGMQVSVMMNSGRTTLALTSNSSTQTTQIVETTPGTTSSTQMTSVERVRQEAMTTQQYQPTRTRVQESSTTTVRTQTAPAAVQGVPALW